MLDNDRCWQAICERDTDFDNHFVFAVRTTGIYCRPSCPARRPSRMNVDLFESAAKAEAAGFRACLRCAPNGQSLVEQMDTLVESACRLLDVPERITLEKLAARIGVSASHLARAFKTRMGVTPRQWAEHRRVQRLQAALPHARNVLDASLESGYSSTRGLYEKADALRPSQRRQRGLGETLHYTLAECPLGHLLMATSPRGVCALLFGDSPDALTRDLLTRFAAAQIVRDDANLRPWLDRVLGQLHEPARASGLPLDLRGTAFQIRVWQALQTIPPGETRTYAALAADLSTHPRAIARACASNAVGLLVPCHRVISSSGAMGGYRWGAERKVRLLRVEQTSPVREPQGSTQDQN
ncbi:bifunctional DNA-binding transcriptional regulator/O6-methylguanine-DNA methyltransferase Ada [Pseudomonas matsuisoli]|uniref:Bifunctional transcriptional regulator/O6-methylguanine-DNA methyltransferase n=1 Tax=Pseudomonas matsuisoli TaxID=1515666 RepID=A0A917Q3B3_9PSED|nr:bifunctional DNA-binding transcriptional regulator/O6-methylguanine-DNA methyltransferase Ada [Pseudomonas matsuisoli]GGK10504.1 bifunctional transcriptional regulator/O6-methylguanine-DNA methyltransferase [Pseudomonas matsuisoli]